MPQPTTAASASRLAAALARLAPLERDVYRLGAVEGLSNGEIASRLGLAPGEVEQLLADALCGLHRELGILARPWWRFW